MLQSYVLYFYIDKEGSHCMKNIQSFIKLSLSDGISLIFFFLMKWLQQILQIRHAY